MKHDAVVVRRQWWRGNDIAPEREREREYWFPIILDVITPGDLWSLDRANLQIDFFLEFRDYIALTNTKTNNWLTTDRRFIKNRVTSGSRFFFFFFYTNDDDDVLSRVKKVVRAIKKRARRKWKITSLFFFRSVPMKFLLLNASDIYPPTFDLSLDGKWKYDTIRDVADSRSSSRIYIYIWETTRLTKTLHQFRLFFFFFPGNNSHSFQFHRTAICSWNFAKTSEEFNVFHDKKKKKKSLSRTCSRTRQWN